MPIGIHMAGKYGKAALMEGVPDYFSVLGEIEKRGLSTQILPLCATSATANLRYQNLGSLRFKPVKIIAQNDEAGLAGARRWKRELEIAGAIVSVWSPPRGVHLSRGNSLKDVDELIQTNPAHQSLTGLFEF